MNAERQPDARILKFIKRNYKKQMKYPEWTKMAPTFMATGLRELEGLRGVERQQVWAALSRLVLAGKITCTGSHRYKSYAPKETRI